jgi:ANTAR domain
MPATEREVRLAEAVLGLARRVADVDVLDLFYDLTDQTLTMLTVQGVGITIVDARGSVRHVTASDERCRYLEEIQIELGEGPCVDGARSSTPLGPVAFGDGSPGATRWPRFAAHARAEGVGAISAVPLRTSEITIGALNLINTRSPVPTGLDLDVAQALASAATACFLNQRRPPDHEQLADQLRGALNNRITVEQAKGVLAERFQVCMDEAFALLRGHARALRLPLKDLAVELVKGRGPSELNPGR